MLTPLEKEGAPITEAEGKNAQALLMQHFKEDHQADLTVGIPSTALQPSDGYTRTAAAPVLSGNVQPPWLHLFYLKGNIQ